jgi:hypothetical protein
MTARDNEPVVTTTMFDDHEKAAWEVAVDRGLPIEAADLRALLRAADDVREEGELDDLNWQKAGLE